MRLSEGMVVDNRYRIDYLIGSGGMADVWLAEDLELPRRVALKVLHDRYARDPEFIALPTTVSQGATSDPQSYTVPEGKKLLITDITMRNPFGDEGKAILVVGTGSSFPFDLVDYREGFDYYRAFRTPIELRAGEVVTFQVTCTAIGEPGAAGCQPTAFLSGTLADA